MKTKLNFLTQTLYLYLQKTERDDTWTLFKREEIFSIPESLRLNISRIITKDLKKKDKNNLRFAERETLTEMKHDKNICMYPLDKGT